MPQPIIPEPTRDPREDLEYCTDCGQFSWRGLGHACPGKPRTTIPLSGLLLAITIGGLLWAGGIYWAATAYAREGAIHPIRAPESLLRARAACPLDKPLKCRAALRRAYEGVEWQRQARNKAHAYTSRDVVIDAIHWASQKTGVPAWRLTAIANCESHLFWLAHNGQYLGVWQLGAQHRADPIFRIVPWQDPYAQAIHTARFIRSHGESAWQCSSGGGLRW